MARFQSISRVSATPGPPRSRVLVAEADHHTTRIKLGKGEDGSAACAYHRSMLLEGSCHCGAVRFRVESPTPVPYRRCYCARCRKTAGGTGAAANVLAQASTLHVDGTDVITEYSAPDTTRTRFCARCGSALWLTIDAATDAVYPFASALDTPLPVAPERVHVFTTEAPAWARPERGPQDQVVERNTPESIEAWHRRHGLREP